MTVSKVLLKGQPLSLNTRAGDTAPTGFGFTGYAVPFNETYARYWEDERFDPGCVFEGMGSAKIAYEHGDTVGRIESWRTDAIGLQIDGVISATALGNDVATLLRDGVLDRLSIAFVGLESRTEYDPTTNRETVVWLRVRVYEVSPVAAPAYEGAELTEVRSKHEGEPQMNDVENKTEQVLSRAELTDAITSALSPFAEQLREVRSSVAASQERNEEPAIEFRSYGAFVKAYARGDERAASIMGDYRAAAREVTLNERAYDGAAMKDAINRAPFIGTAIALAAGNRQIIDTFQTSPLPESGMAVDFGKLKSNTVAVGKQADEGDTLSKGKIELETDTAPVQTFGGYSEVSIQVIERASEDYLNLLHTAQTLAYSKQTEAEALALLEKISTDNLAAGHKLAQVLDPQVNDWVSLIIDATQTYRDLGMPLDGMFLTKDKFKKLVTLADKNDRLQFTVYGTGTNSVGELKTPELEAILPGGLRVRMRGGAADTGEFYSSLALKTWESAGAPMTLQDTNVTSLVGNYSVYGYMANGAEMPDGILPIEFATE